MSVAPRKSAAASGQPIACTPRHLPGELLLASARQARQINPRNHPLFISQLQRVSPATAISPEHIAVMTAKYWQTGGVRLSVSFLDTPPAALRSRILTHMNAWNETANVTFTETSGAGDVRIARTIGDGHWSYLGTDILLADHGKPTMNLDGFTMETPDSEFFRVVRHETGHTLGCPHEHMRRDMIDRIDQEAAIRYYMASQGWTRDEVIQQVLTPISAGSIRGTGASDALSIMCYQIPANLTKDNIAIPGGTDIDPTDRAFMAQIYPKGAAASAPTGNASVGPAQRGAAPVAEQATLAVAAAESAPHVTRHVPHHDCVELDLAGGERMHVHPDATSDQIRRVIEALRA